MGSKGGGTIGFRYYMSLHMGLCRGPINEIVEIRVGGITAWTGNACTDDLILIDKPDLFGGDEKEGGIVGPLKVYWGEKTQVLAGAIATALGTLPAIATSIGGLVPAFRGVTTLWFHGEICALNPYPKEWAFRVRRSTNGWYKNQPWYPAKCAIYTQDEQGNVIKGHNGAHIIYECITNPTWGSGEDAETIDENSFILAANTLCSEGLALCLKYSRESEIGEFVKIVLDHIRGSLYIDRTTGLQTLRLIRGDYDPDDVPVFHYGNGLLSIVADDTESGDEGITEVICEYHNPVTNEDGSVRAQNPGARQSQEGSNSSTLNLPGLPTKALASRAALSELTVISAGLKRFKVTLDRRGYRIAPAGVFIVQCPEKGIASVILRAGEIDDGDGTSGIITISAVEDVFGFPETGLIVPEDPSWSPPSSEALPAAVAKLVEASYRDLYILLGADLLPTVDDDDAFLGQLAATPQSNAYQYDLLTRADGEPDLVDRANGFFTGTGTLTAAVEPLDTEIAFASSTVFSLSVGEAVLLGDEVVRVEAYDPDDPLVMTIARGCGDTIPQAHAIGTRLWTMDDDMASDRRPYTAGEEVHTKVLTRTSTDLLTEAEADEQDLTLVGRPIRPYAPADVRVTATDRPTDHDSIYALDGPYAEPTVEWVERNRLTQADHLISHTEANVAQEAGTTYTIRVYSGDGLTLLRTEAGITDDFWQYADADQATDGNPSTVFIELEAERDGHVSYSVYRFHVILTGGYGLGYGLGYGGA